MVSSKRKTREPQSEMKPEMSKLIDIKECKKTRIAVKLKQSPKDLILEKKKKGRVLWTTGLRTLLECRDEKDKNKYEE